MSQPHPTCDLCGQASPDLVPLRDIYAPPHIRNVCPRCGKWCDKKLSEIRDKQAPELRKAISDQAAKPRRPWWKFFL